MIETYTETKESKDKDTIQVVVKSDTSSSTTTTDKEKETEKDYSNYPIPSINGKLSLFLLTPLLCLRSALPLRSTAFRSSLSF